MRALRLFDLVATIQNFQQALEKPITPIIDLYLLTDDQLYKLKCDLEIEYEYQNS